MIELRLLAEVSADPAFVQAFRRGDDLHRLTAATMYGGSMEEVTKEQRSDAKRINFGGRGAERSHPAQRIEGAIEENEGTDAGSCSLAEFRRCFVADPTAAEAGAISSRSAAAVPSGVGAAS